MVGDGKVHLAIMTTHTNQSIPGFVYGALHAKSVTTMIQRCNVAMVTKDYYGCDNDYQ